MAWGGDDVWWENFLVRFDYICDSASERTISQSIGLAWYGAGGGGYDQCSTYSGVWNRKKGCTFELFSSRVEFGFNDVGSTDKRACIDSTST